MATILNYNKLCTDVQNVDPKIRFAGVINPRGRLVAGGMKEGIEPLENPKDDEMLFMELSLRARMRHEFDSEFGKVKFSMSYREKVIFISFPLPDDNVLLISGDTSLDFSKVSFATLKKIE